MLVVLLFYVFFSDSLPGFDDQSPVMKSALHTHYAHLTNTTALRWAFIIIIIINIFTSTTMYLFCTYFSFFLPWFNGQSFCLLSSFLRLTTDASFFVLLVESVLSLILLLLLLIFKIRGRVEWLLTKIWNFLALSAIMFLKSNLALISNCLSSKPC